jgi:hypothetical protein
MFIYQFSDKLCVFFVQLVWAESDRMQTSMVDILSSLLIRRVFLIRT